MTREEHEALRARVLGGHRRVVAFDLAVLACHLFARMSGCPAGGDVIGWLSSRADAVTAAWRAELEGGEGREP